MDFFTAQDRAQRRSRWLLLWFVCGVLTVSCGIYALAWGIERMLHDFEAERRPAVAPVHLWDPTRVALCVGGCLLLIGGGSLWRILQLRRGGAAVAESLGARRLEARTRDPLEQRLRNIVEEMALASGVPAPGIYVLDHEPAINAFAAGFSPRDAVVAVSAGALRRLRRDELQGVVAHEFSHILNGDMRLNLQLAGVIYGIFLLNIIGLTILRGIRLARGNRGKGAAGVVILALVIGGSLWLLGVLGAAFGRLMQAAISRQREYLADASAVQFTRNPEGIANALRRLGGDRGGRITQPVADYAHFFFAQPFAAGLRSPFATHPPLEQRIRAVLPQWDGTYLAAPDDGAAADLESTDRAVPPPPPRTAAVAAFDDGESVEQRVLGAVGTVPLHAVEAAQRLHACLPPGLLNIARAPDGCRRLLLALVLAAEPEARAAQLRVARSWDAADLPAALESLAAELAALGPLQRIALVQAALPNLTARSLEEGERLLQGLMAFIHADGRVTLMEWGLAALVRQRLDVLARGVAASIPGVSRAEAVAPAANRLCFMLANLEAPDAATAAAWVREAALGTPFAELLGAPIESNAAELDEALALLQQTRFPLRRHFLQCCLRIVLQNGEVGPEERPLVRILALALECPVPAAI